MMSKIKTNQGVELLRLVLMYMIVLQHVIGHGAGFLEFINSPSPRCIPVLKHWLLYTPCVMAVDCFVFISGYYGMKTSMKKVVRLVFQAITTAAILFLAYFSVNTFDICHIEVATRELISMCFPVGFNYWWFLSMYVVLLVLSSFLNKYTELTNKDRWCILFVLFWINSIGGLLFNTAGANLGYSLINFIFIYLLGRELSISSIFSKHNSIYPLFYLLSLISLYAMVFYSKDMGPVILKRVFAYNNPLVLLNAILFFRMFLYLNITINIKAISKYSLGIYLLHDNPIVRPLLAKYYSDEYFIPMTFVLFFICLSVEAMRSNILDKIWTITRKRA